ncbi:hypothetical protein SDC9_209071 [bioreactor metagenome]|uniref:Transcriptional regulator DauR-like HTH domain-containing protein n=1 Tax=bioreactor metagenome TaxID=1076179 RepID=A0A645JC91_9ZZZZ
MNNEIETEISDHSIEEYTVEIIHNVITSSNIPADRMTPDEKTEILKKMKDKGVFRIKGAVREIARQLETSEPTIYRYLKTIEQQ